MNYSNFKQLLLPLLGVLGAVDGGAYQLSNTVNDDKANRQNLEVKQRHNLVLEAATSAKGKSLYLKPYKV